MYHVTQAVCKNSIAYIIAQDFNCSCYCHILMIEVASCLEKLLVVNGEGLVAKTKDDVSRAGLNKCFVLLIEVAT